MKLGKTFIGLSIFFLTLYGKAAVLGPSPSCGIHHSAKIEKVSTYQKFIQKGYEGYFQKWIILNIKADENKAIVLTTPLNNIAADFKSVRDTFTSPITIKIECNHMNVIEKIDYNSHI